MSLFPALAGRQGAAAAVPPLVQLNAGKCQLSERTANNKYQVTADNRRGQITLTRGNDGILHFKWINKANGTVEDDRMIMSGGEATFKKVKTGRQDPNDRVFMLKYFAGGKPLMYWMQDVDASKDDELVAKVNEYLNNPAAAAPVAAGAAAGLPAAGGAAGLPPELMQMLGLPPGFQLASQANAAPAPAPAVSAIPSGVAASPFGTLDLSSLLGSTGGAASSARPHQAFGQQRQQPPATPNLQDILVPEEVLRTGILTDPAVRAELINMLPPEQQTEENLERNLRSPQFQQALGSLTSALRNPDNLQSVMSNFQLDPSAGHQFLLQGDGVGAFLAAVQAAAATAASSASPAAPGSQDQPPNSSAESKDNDEMDQT